MVKKQKNTLKQAVYVFFCALCVTIVINYFGSLFLYDEIRIFFAVDILFSLVVSIVSCFRNLYRRIEEMEQRIKKLEYQLSKRK